MGPPAKSTGSAAQAARAARPAAKLPARLRLDDQLCFALYAATNSVVRAYRPLLAALGLTYPQYLVMIVLWEGGPSGVGDIADHLALPGHAVSPILNRLEDAGLIRRRRSPDDKRAVTIELTPAGAELEADASQAQAAVVCRTGMDPDALAALREALHRLVDDMTTPQPDSQPNRTFARHRGEAS